jgi:hypothetical protein
MSIHLAVGAKESKDLCFPAALVERVSPLRACLIDRKKRNKFD